MKFGAFPLEAAEGALLAHTHRLQIPDGRQVLKKGLRLDPSHLALLRQAGLSSVVCARLEPEDVEEDEAATELGRALTTPTLRAEPAATGRVNLVAAVRGRFDVQADAVHRANRLDPRLTLATREPGTVVAAGELVATVKIIPFAVPRVALDATLAALGQAPLRLDRLRPLRVGLVLTELPGVAPSQLERALENQRTRIRDLGGQLRWVEACPHAPAPLGAALRRQAESGAELVLALGASAVVDEDDVLPASVRAAGGTVSQVGIPVDPGNLLVLGRIHDVPFVGIPGCARSLRRNGYDLVLERLFAGLEVGPETLRGLGVGGLLEEIPSRPSPRRSQPAPTPRVAALALAAGRSSRMGAPNKLLAPLEDRPMIAHVVDRLLSAPLEPILVVLGHQAAEVRAALGARPVRFIDNPRFEGGMASSIRAGFQELPDGVHGALVMLGDMPFVPHAVLEALRAALPLDRPAIVVPITSGRRGHPVLFSRHFFEAMVALEGDRGARDLLHAHPEAIIEIEVDDDGVVFDVDTPPALAEAQRRLGHPTALPEAIR